MKVLLFVCLLCSLLVRAQTQTASTTCTSSPEVERDLRRLVVRSGLPVEKSLEARKKILAELLQQHPDDLFVHLEARETVNSTIDQLSLVDRYQRLFQGNPKSSQYKFLYARALVGHDTPRAMELLREVETVDPTYAWPYLEFAEIHTGRKYIDLSQFRGELEKFFDLCPSSLDWSAWSLLVDRGTPEMSARHAHVLRERLMTESDHYIQRYYWKLLWSLEFKAAPVTEHARLREQIEADLARLEEAPGAADGKWLAFLSAGYGIADDPGNVKRIEQQLLTKYPDSQEAKSILDEHWWKEHPWPGASPDEQNQPFYKALLQRQDELLKTSPNDSMLLLFRFTALGKLEDTTAEQLTTAADRLLEALPKDPIWQALPPVRIQIAQVFIQRRINPERVSGLVEDGLRLESENERRWDTETDETKASYELANLRLKTQAARLLASAAKELGKPEVARAAVTELDKLKPDTAEDRSAIWAAKAAFAEAEGRNLDALLMYQAAIKSRPADFVAGKRDELADNEDRLWKVLGGSSASCDLWEKKAKITEVATEGRWQIPTKAMSAWELSDLQGRTWKMGSFSGKTVLISVWASWCGPCRSELPSFQKLFDEMKDRPDVQVLSFNIDREIEEVAPFLQQQGYTFPVLLASSYVDELLGDVGIPQVWIVDAQGKWLWEQVGFDPRGGKWRESVLEKIEPTRASH